MAMLKAGAATVTVGVGVTVTGDEIPPPDNVTGIVTGVPFAAVMFPVTVITEKLCPAASASLRVQVVVARVHVHPVPEIAVTVKPIGGSAAVTVPLVAPFPVFDTVIV